MYVRPPPSQLFQDNSHIGRFVNSLAQELEAFRRKPGIDGPEELLDSNEENPPSNGPVRAKTGKHLRSPLAEQASSPQSELAPTAAHEAHGITPDASILTQQGDSGKGSDKDLGMSTASHGLEPEDVVPITAPGDLKGGKDNIPREWSRALESLWVYDSDGQAVLFADVSVYTRWGFVRKFLPGVSFADFWLNMGHDSCSPYHYPYSIVARGRMPGMVLRAVVVANRIFAALTPGVMHDKVRAQATTRIITHPQE